MDERWLVRRAAAADVAGLLALWRAAERPVSVTDSEAGIGTLLERDPGALLVAELDGEVVGSLVAAWDGWRGTFYRLAVHPRRRRLGIATALLREGERRLRDLGAIRLSAITLGEEPGAPGFWVSAGYTRQAGASRFIREL